MTDRIDAVWVPKNDRMKPVSFKTYLDFGLPKATTIEVAWIDEAPPSIEIYSEIIARLKRRTGDGD